MQIKTIRSQIALGFGVLLMLLALLTLGGGYFISSISNSFERYEQLRQQSTRMERLELLITQMRRSVDLYASRGSKSSQNKVGSYLGEIRELVKVISGNEANAERKLIIEEMEGVLDNYDGLFEVLIRDRLYVKQVLENDLPNLYKRVTETFVQVESGWSSSDLYLTEKIKSSFLQAQESLLVYFLRLDTSYLQESRSALQEANDGLIGLEQKHPQMAADLKDLFDQFRLLVLGGVQGTRNYLYFANVLLAGHTYELAYNIRKVNNLARSDAAAILVESLGSLEMLLERGLVVTFVGILIGMMAAMLLSRKLAAPLVAITQTFRDLANGRHVQHMPGEQRKDEIGALAKAAQAFKRKNEETEAHLQREAALTLELMQQREALALSNAQLDSFAYVASHDLKAPLRAIARLAEWVIDDSGVNLSGTSREHLTKISDRIKRMQALLDDLLEYSRVGRTASDLHEVHCEELLDNVVNLADRPEGFEIVVAEGLPVLRTSPIALEQVFLNLITNAIKYNDKERGFIQIGFEEEDDCVRFFVEDNGPGIEQRYHAKIFEMFQRCVPKGSIDGTGMGLALVKKHVEHRGGIVEVASEMGKGTKFSFTWPRSEQFK